MSRFIQRTRSGRVAGLRIAGILIAAAAAGCSSGRVGGVLVIDDGVVVSDALSTGQTAICRNDRVQKVPGQPVAALRVSRWLVFTEPRKTLLYVRTSPLRSEQRLPAVCIERRLRVVELETGRSARLENPLDNHDDQIARLVLDGERLLAEVTERYAAPPIPPRYRYFAYSFAEPKWTPLPREAAAAAFPRWGLPGRYADLRTLSTVPAAAAASSGAPGAREDAPPGKWRGVRTFDEFQRRGLHRGSWGELVERRHGGLWEVIYHSPDGQELRVFRQNTSAAAAESALDLAGLSAEEPGR